METQALATTLKQSPLAVVPDDVSAGALELAVGKNDLSRLSPSDRMKYIGQICKWAGLNPLTQPIKIINIKGKDTLYADKSCAEQLRGIYHISTTILERVYQDGCYIVRAKARTPDGQEDESIGAVPCHDRATGEDKANAMMKAETKAKRRVTLSIKGLGFLPDESELETMREVKTPADVVTGAQTDSDRAAALAGAIEAEVISPEKGSAGSGTGVENGKPAQDHSQTRTEHQGPETESDARRGASEQLHAAPSTQPSATTSEATAPQATATPANPAAPGDLVGADGKLKPEVVANILNTFHQGDPEQCLAYLVSKDKIKSGATLEFLDPTAANFILRVPKRFHQNVKDWAKTQQA